MLHNGDNICVTAGAASASLFGLLFIVVTRGAGFSSSAAITGAHVFLTPTRVHFGSVPLLSLGVLAPLASPQRAVVVLCICGLSDRSTVAATLCRSGCPLRHFDCPKRPVRSRPISPKIERPVLPHHRGSGRAAWCKHLQAMRCPSTVTNLGDQRCDTAIVHQRSESPSIRSRSSSPAAPQPLMPAGIAGRNSS